MAMKLTFLGTGTSTGVPTIGCGCEVCRSNDARDKRLRCSSLLEVDGKKILFDCGPDFRMQAINANINWIDAILLTHGHSDHVAGMDDLRTIPYAKYHWHLPEELDKGEVELPKINMYGLKRTNDSVRKLFFYCFPKPDKTGPHYTGMLPLLTLHDLPEPVSEFKVADGISVLPIQAMHAYLPVLGYRIRNFAYLTDLKTIEESEVEKLYGLDVLVLGMLRHNKPHGSHLSLDEAMEIVDKVKPKRTYFVHMSHDIGFHADFHDLRYHKPGVVGDFPVPSNCNLAYDGLEVEIAD